MVIIIYQVILILVALVNIQLITAAAFPASLPTTGQDLVQLANGSSLISSISSWRKLQVSCHSFGQQIPPPEVIGTFRDLTHSINANVEAYPDHRLMNDRFEYRGDNDRILIMVAANVGEELTWRDLSRVLLAVKRYMTGGINVPQEHYQEMNFRLIDGSQQIIGNGLVWYSAPGKTNQTLNLNTPNASFGKQISRCPQDQLDNWMKQFPDTFPVRQETKILQTLR